MNAIRIVPRGGFVLASIGRFWKRLASTLLLAVTCCHPHSILAQPKDVSHSRAEATEPVTESPQQRRARFEQGPRRVFRDRVEPHWFAGNTRFWYRNDLPNGQREFVVVDAVNGTRELAFDHELVARQISPPDEPRLPIDDLRFGDDGRELVLVGAQTSWALTLADGELRELSADTEKRALPSERLPAGAEVRPSRRTGPETQVTFDNRLADSVEIFWIDAQGGRQSYGTMEPGGRKDQQTFAGHVWLVTNRQGGSVGVFEATEQPAVAIIDGSRIEVRERRGRRHRDDDISSDRSPDGKWSAFIKDSNVYVKAIEDGKEIQLSTDGNEGLAYGRLAWAPDSKTLVAFRIEPGERKEVYLVQSSPEGGGRARLQTRPYALPGDKFTTYELSLFDVAIQKQLKPQVDRFEHEWLTPLLHWDRDGRRLAYEQIDRGHQRFRVIEVDIQTGEVRNLIDEQGKTFIWTAHTENLGLNLVNWLEQTDEIIYVSEQSGWRHLYLVDAAAGRLTNAITTGEWVVRAIDLIDEPNRQVWFRASGVFPNQDPYLTHYGRVNFDGGGLIWLTVDNGDHRVQFSPDRQFMIDTYSRVDMPPVTDLWRASDGQFVCRLEEADITQLTASGWQSPEVFVEKGRDGETDIWGIIVRPQNFDPSKKYPVIEDIYAGPQGSFVPKSFSGSSRYESLTRLGFIVVKIDGMGTANRSKAFHDVCWRNLKDAGFEDRILWMRAAAQKYPYMDLTRVGVYGNSAGGQNAAGALLFHPYFYKVAVASCGCHDNRMDKASWNEQWMGYPVGPQYSECSNIDNAHRLRGKLFLIVGEMDNNVPPESTLRFVDALIDAGKVFELLVVPNGGHGMGGSYGERRMHDFFARHLLGEEPPDRNAELPPTD